MVQLADPLPVRVVHLRSLKPVTRVTGGVRGVRSGVEFSLATGQPLCLRCVQFLQLIGVDLILVDFGDCIRNILIKRDWCGVENSGFTVKSSSRLFWIIIRKSDLFRYIGLVTLFL